MSKTIALSMRFVTKYYPNGSEEVFNALASSWFDFLLEAFPVSSCIAMPSNIQLCKNIIKNHQIDALVLSGGDDIGLFPQRDDTELALLQWAEKHTIPTLGVCRGMQLINNYYGGSLHADKKHIATKHSLSFPSEYNEIFSEEVNSYHNNIIFTKNLAPSLSALAYADMNTTVEAFKHIHNNIYGIMWHPEREEKFKQSDILLFRAFLSSRF